MNAHDNSTIILSHESITNQECLICFNIRPVVKLSCNHKICAVCINDNLKYRANCPFCRKIIVNCEPNIFTCKRKMNCVSVNYTKIDKMVGISVSKNKNGKIYISYKSPSCKLNVDINDILCSINGMPCQNPKCVADIIKESTSFTLYVEKASLFKKLIGYLKISFITKGLLRK